MNITAAVRIRKTGVKQNEEYESVPDPLDHTGLYMPGTWSNWHHPADSPYRALFHGHGILLCEKFKAASWLVHRNESLYETSGQLCEAAGHDYGDETADRRDRDRGDGGWLSDDEQGSGGTDLSGCCVGMPPVVFLSAGKDR